MAGSLPNVGRPKGNAWRRLQDEGIVWEGQVLITGDETDLAALLIVTNMRLAFVRGGELALDIDRDWLDPAPVLRRTGTVQLWVSPPGDPISESLTFIARDGRDEAAVLLSLIGDHGAYGSAYRLPTYVPDTAPEPIPFQAARSRRRRHAYDDHRFNPPPALPVFSVLDDDDFPPVVPHDHQDSSWEQAIAESLESGAPVPLAASIRNPNDPLRPIDGFDSREERDRRSWVIRIAGLFLTVGLISAIASGLMPGLDDVRDRFDSPDPTAQSVAQIDMPSRTPELTPTPAETVDPTTTAAGPSSSDPRDPTVIPLETAVALGVGSDQPSETPTTTPEPTAEPEPTPTSTEEAVQVAQATDEPAATDQTPVIPPPDPADAPTESSEPEPTATEEEITEPAPAFTETEEVAEPQGQASGALQDQEASLASSEAAAQTFETNGLRVQISAAYRAESLPDLTLGRSAAGDWVVLLLEAVNWSSEPSNLAMPDFRLAPASDLTAEIPLDAASGAVTSYLDLWPGLRPTESAVVPPGGYQPIALVFSVPAGLESPVLLAGEQAIALDLSFENQSSGQLQGPGFAAPALVTGTVVDVIDGQTVSMDIDGETTMVRYYGLQAPGACYTEESVTANSSLVAGQTLLLERERRNRSETTTYLRDAWIVDESGDRHLVAATLVAEGAALPEPSDPDIRFAGWLAGKALLAESAGAGLWSACG